jgi:hypothetical protein
MANFNAFLAPAPVGQAEQSTLQVRIFLPEFFFIADRNKTQLN